MSQTTGRFQRAIGKAAQTYTLHRWEPLPYDPELAADRDRRIRRVNERFISYADPCARLDPFDREWGYLHSTETIEAAFTGERDSIGTTYLQTNTAVSWQSTAVLYIPPEVELYRWWAEFAPARGADKAQFKRTVYAIEHDQEWWVIQHQHERHISGEVAYRECDLIPIQSADMGAPSFFNPFALTYQDQSDKPYALFPCALDLWPSIPDEYATEPSYPCPECDPCPDCPDCPEPPTPPVLANVTGVTQNIDARCRWQFDQAVHFTGLDPAFEAYEPDVGAWFPPVEIITTEADAITLRYNHDVFTRWRVVQATTQTSPGVAQASGSIQQA